MSAILLLNCIRIAKFEIVKVTITWKHTHHLGLGCIRNIFIAVLFKNVVTRSVVLCHHIFGNRCSVCFYSLHYHRSSIFIVSVNSALYTNDSDGIHNRRNINVPEWYFTLHVAIFGTKYIGPGNTQQYLFRVSKCRVLDYI